MDYWVRESSRIFEAAEWTRYTLWQLRRNSRISKGFLSSKTATGSVALGCLFHQSTLFVNAAAPWTLKRYWVVISVSTAGFSSMVMFLYSS
jgi:hypothetical protein